MSVAGLVRIAQVSREASPLRDFHADFFSEDPRLRERNRKAHARIQQHIVIGIVAKIPAENIGIQAQLAKECFRHSALVKVSAPRPHRQSQHRRADGIEKRRAGNEQILDSGRLENTIIRSVKQQVERWNESRYTDSRTPRRLVYDKSVMIEPQSRADVPPAQAHLVLHVNRRLDIPFLLIRKLKIQLCPGIELSRIGYRVLQRLVHRTENTVHARFPIVMPVVPREIGAQISFAVAAVLRNDHRRGLRV